jgi:hypothetical protein
LSGNCPATAGQAGLQTGYSIATPFTGSMTEILSKAGITTNETVNIFNYELTSAIYQIRPSFLLSRERKTEG